MPGEATVASYQGETTSCHWTGFRLDSECFSPLLPTPQHSSLLSPSLFLCPSCSQCSRARHALLSSLSSLPLSSLRSSLSSSIGVCVCRTLLAFSVVAPGGGGGRKGRRARLSVRPSVSPSVRLRVSSGSEQKQRSDYAEEDATAAVVVVAPVDSSLPLFLRQISLLLSLLLLLRSMQC